MTSPCLESSPTHSHLPKPCKRKTIIFKTKPVVIENTLPNVGKNMGLPSEANVLENLPKQSWSSSEMICWTVSQPHSPKIHPVKFLSQPCSFFRKSMSCTYLIPRLPCAYEMHYAISTQFISHMQIYHHAYIYIIKHIKHVIHIHHQFHQKLAHMG